LHESGGGKSETHSTDFSSRSFADCTDGSFRPLRFLPTAKVSASDPSPRHLPPLKRVPSGSPRDAPRTLSGSISANEQLTVTHQQSESSTSPPALSRIEEHKRFTASAHQRAASRARKPSGSPATQANRLQLTDASASASGHSPSSAGHGSSLTPIVPSAISISPQTAALQQPPTNSATDSLRPLPLTSAGAGSGYQTAGASAGASTPNVELSSMHLRLGVAPLAVTSAGAAASTAAEAHSGDVQSQLLQTQHNKPKNFSALRLGEFPGVGIGPPPPWTQVCCCLLLLFAVVCASVNAESKSRIYVLTAVVCG
jgi:hypothetical protein